MFAVRTAIPENGSLRLTIGSAPADIEVSAVHPLGQGQLHLQLNLDNGRVSTAEVILGFGHRGDEKLLELRDFRQGLSLINRHNWLTPVAAEIAYAQACEELMGLTPPPRAAALRQLVLALQTSTGWLQLLAGLDDSHHWLRQREGLVELTEALTGARLHVSFIRLGGIAHDVDNELVATVQSCISNLEIPDAHLPELSSLISNLRNAVERTRLACDTAQSIESKIAVSLPKVVRVPIGQAYSEVVATTGCVGVWLHSDGGKSPLRVGLRAPSMVSLHSWQQHAIGSQVMHAIKDLVVTPLCIGELER